MQINICHDHAIRLKDFWPGERANRVAIPVEQHRGAPRPPSGTALHVAAAKLRLRLAGTAQERQAAVALASEAGMSRREIQEFLNWIDAVGVYQAESNARSRYCTVARDWLARQLRVIALNVPTGRGESMN